MSHSFTVLHFGGQCPWHLWAIDQATEAAEVCHGTVDVIDISRRPRVAAYHRMFFPFMTIVDNSIRVPSPVDADELRKIADGYAPSGPTPRHEPGPQEIVPEIAPLTAENISDSCSLCMAKYEESGCRAKHLWMAKVSTTVPAGILGFIAYDGKTPKGVVEFLPAPLIPYPLPEKDPQAAFITCIYPSDSIPNYRSQLLGRLIDYLSPIRFRKLQVIAGRRSPYPNGPVSFFQSHGFIELAEVDQIVLKEGQEELVLMSTSL